MFFTAAAISPADTAKPETERQPCQTHVNKQQAPCHFPHGHAEEWPKLYFIHALRYFTLANKKSGKLRLKRLILQAKN